MTKRIRIDEEDYKVAIKRLKENNPRVLYKTGSFLMSQGGEEELLKALIARKYDLPGEAVCLEMLDFFKIVAMGAKKYEMNNWLKPNGIKSSEREMHDSIGHHWGRSYASNFGGSRLDESGYDHLLHGMCRMGMAYTRRQRGIIHPEDKDE